MRRLMQPQAVIGAEVLHQPFGLGRGQLADGVHAQGLQPGAGLGADAVDALGRQRPDALRDPTQLQQGQAIGLVQIGAQLGQQLVGRDADRAAQPGGVVHGVLQALAERADTAQRVAINRVLRARHLGQVEVDLVDAPVFHHRGDLDHGGLEQARVAAVLVEIRGQQDGIGRQGRGLHQAHGRVHAKGAGRVGGGGDHAAAGVMAEGGKAQRTIWLRLGLVAAPPADDHRLAGELRVAQQFNGRVEGVHVQVGDPASAHAGPNCSAWARCPLAWVIRPGDRIR